MEIDKTSTKFQLYNKINENLNYSFYISIKLKLNEYIKNNGENQSIIKMIDLIIEPEKLLSTEVNDRVNFFDNPIIGHELILPISNRIDKFNEFSKEFKSNKEISELINGLILGYKNSINQYIKNAIKNKESKQRMNIYQTKINLLTEDLEHRNVDLCFAYEMASYDPIHEFDYVKLNKSGNSFGRKLQDVYYKVDNGTRLLRPAKEDANYNFYCGLFGMDQQFISPTQLLILNKIPILPSNLTESQERKEIFKIKKENGFVSNKQVFENFPQLKEDVKTAMKLERTIAIQSSLFRGGISFQNFLEDLEKENENQDKILESSIDLNSFSSHILASLLLIPTDYKPDNLILDLNTKQIIGIDNDQCLEFDEFEKINSNNCYISIKNVLYTLSPLMNKPIDRVAVGKFVSQVPELFILNWLLLLYEKEKIYNKMVENSLLSMFADVKTTPDIMDGASLLSNEQQSIINIKESLGLPLLFPKGWINSLFERFTKIKTILIKNNQTTHQQLFKQVYPFASVYYESLSRFHPKPLDQISALYNNSKDFQRDLSINPPSDSFFKELSEAKFIKPDPIVSIKESLIEFISTVNVKNLHLESNLFFTEIIKLIIKISKELNVNSFSFEKSWYSTIQTSLLILIKQRVPFDIVQQFISLLKIDISKLEKEENSKSIIHLLISQDYGKEIIMNGISILKSIGANIDIVEGGLSPLEFIINRGGDIGLIIEFFKFLVGLGAGKSCSDSVINKFYGTLSREQKCNIKESIIKLSDINPKVGWILSLNHLFPLIKPSINYDENKLLLTTTKGKRLISKEQWNQVFNKDNKPIKTNEYGKRCVPFVQDSECGHKIYLKFEPQFPGTELAVSTLGYQLFGYISPFSELAMINGVPVLLIQEVKGVTLNDFIKNDESKISLIDPSNISKLLVFEMLINNADGNFGNYIINENENGKFNMYSIDNDQSFMPPVAKELNTRSFLKNKLSLQVETCMFLFDQMNHIVHHDVIESLKDRDLILEIRKWLNSLNCYHLQWIEFFKNNQIKNTGTNEIKCVIGVSFASNQIKLLFSKVVRLVNLLRKPITHFQLLSSLEPLIANRYKLIFNLYPLNKYSIYDRFNHLKNPKNDCNNIQLLTSSVYSSAQILESREIPSIESIQNDIKSGKFSPSNALNELKEIQFQHSSMEQIFKDLLSNSGTNNSVGINSIKSKEPQKNKPINNIADSIIEEFLKKSDFSLLTPSQETTLFKFIKSKELVNLYIRKSRSLKTSTLNTFNFNNLSILNITHCESLQSFTSITLLSKVPIHFPCLIKLKLDHCSGLSELLIEANNLEYLSASHCKSLGTTFKIDCPNIKYLNLSNGSLSNIGNLSNLISTIEFDLLDISNNPLADFSNESQIGFFKNDFKTKELIYNNLKCHLKKNDSERTIHSMCLRGYSNLNLVLQILGNLGKPHILNDSPLEEFTGITYSNGFQYKFNYESEFFINLSTNTPLIKKYTKVVILIFDPSNEYLMFNKCVVGYYNLLKSVTSNQHLKFILFGATKEYQENCQSAINFYNNNKLEGDLILIYETGVDTLEKVVKLHKKLFDYIETCYEEIIN